MEDKERGPPVPSVSTAKQEQDPSSAEDTKYSNILPSMPPQDKDEHPELRHPAAPQSQALLPPYTPMQSYDQMPGYMQSHATSYPLQESGGRSESILPPLGHPPYSSSTQGTGTHSLLPSLGSAPPMGPPMHSHPGYGSYQSSPYAYGSSGQGYPYDSGTSSMLPYPSSGASGAQTPYAASSDGNVSPMMEAGSSYYGSIAYPYYGSGYSQQYEGQSSYGYYGAQQRGQGYYRRGYGAPTGRSRATNPGKPIFRDRNRSGPEGANLFVFHIPNDMTNANLFELFKQYGNVLSVRIMTEENTGRGRGFGFVSYDCPEAAADAINGLNGFEINGKRLKVELKLNDSRSEGRRYPSPAPGLLPSTHMPMNMPGHATGVSQPNTRQNENAQVQSSQPVLPRDYTRQNYPDPSKSSAHSDHPTTEFVPVQEARRESISDKIEYPQDVPPTGFVPVPASAPVSATHRPPVLPPPLSTANQESAQTGEHYALRKAASPSPLADMNDIRKSLPDSDE